MRIRIDLKIFIFLIIFYFTNQIRNYLIIMLFCFIHEIGHIIAGLILNMKPEKLEIMPFGLSSSFYMDFDNKNFKLKEILVVLSGPLTSLALIFLCKNIDLIYITFQEAMYSNILILIFNLIPIYPLDGGRLIKGIFQIKIGSTQAEVLVNKISDITIIILTVISSIGVYYFQNVAIFFVCIFLWMIALKEKNDKTLAILQGK